MKTPSLWYAGTRRLEVRDVDLPDPGPDEALVQVEVCGVCTWDLFIFSGGFQKEKPFPFYFGHEGIGRVLKTGARAKRVREGGRVALRENPEIGQPGTGHMAAYAVLPETLLIPLPEDGRPATQWLIEPVACCVNAIDRAAVKCGERVALVGCGFMGSILLQGLLLTPAAEVTAFEVRPELLRLARSFGRPGLLSAFDPRELDEALLKGLEGVFDVVIETAATEPAFHLANRLVKKGGRLVIFSWHHRPFTVDLGSWHVRGISALNVSPAAHPHFDDCFYQSIALLEKGRIDLGPLVTHLAAPEQAQGLYEKGLAKSEGYIKGAIRWS